MEKKKKLIDIETVEHEWELDCNIDPVQLDVSSLDTSKLHSKYLKYYNKIRLHLISLDEKLSNEIHVKTLYYSGKLSREELIQHDLEPFQMKVLRTDVKTFIESDKAIRTLRSKIEYYKIFQDFVKLILEQLNKRSFDIKNIIEHRKFVSGEH